MINVINASFVSVVMSYNSGFLSRPLQLCRGAWLCAYVNGKLSMVFNCNCFPKMKDYSRLRPHKGSHVHRKCGSIEEIVQDTHVVTTHQ